MAVIDRWSVGQDKEHMWRLLTSAVCRNEKAVVCAAAYSASGVYCRAQCPVRHPAAARMDSDQVLAVMLAPKARMTNQNEG